MDKREELYMKSLSLRKEVNKIVEKDGELHYEEIPDEKLKKSFEMIRGKGFFLFIIDEEDKVTFSNISCLSQSQQLKIISAFTCVIKDMLKLP